MTLDIKDRLYTSSEVAEILGVSLRSVYRYLEEGKLDADIKTATGRHRFSRKNILDFLQPSDSVSRNASNDNKKADISPQPNSLTSEDLSTASKFSPNETIEDEFDFDKFFETEIVKPNENTSSISENASKSGTLNTGLDTKSNNSFLDEEEDLEKLFEELEKEFASNNSSQNDGTEKKISKLADDEFDFDFDFLENGESVVDYLKSDTNENTAYFTEKTIKDESQGVPKFDSQKEKDDEFDFDFLDDFFKEEDAEESKVLPSATIKEETKISRNSDKEEKDSYFNLDSIFSDLLEVDDEKDTQSKFSNLPDSPKEENKAVEAKEDESESWLEKFRKASEKVTETKTKNENDDDFDLSSFFSDKNQTSSIVSEKKEVNNNPITSSEETEDFRFSKESRKKEYYYISSLSGPKEIAQTIDKVSRKFDLDYAFTLNAGLSLHKDISPFTLINVYINERDLEIFEDYLKLTPSSDRDAHICLMMAKDREIFEDSYELNGLFVVSNVQLRSDFIDKGMDNYAREV